jgi:hypothetical protein
VDLAADVVRTLLELKRDYLGDDSPTSWQPGDIRELLLDVIPRKVTADEGWIDAGRFAPSSITSGSPGSPGRGRAGRRPLADADRLWLIVDSASALPDLGGQVQLEAVVEGLWRCDHPQTVDVLEAVGRSASDKKPAKAARKAAFKARSRAATR